MTQVTAIPVTWPAADIAFDRARVAAAWQAFVDGTDPNPTDVRTEIRESWYRSRDGGVDPLGVCAPAAGNRALAQQRARNRELLTAADHTWQLLSESLAASDNVMVVADRDGVILDVRGSEEFVAAAGRQLCEPGRDWSERASGTNAIGTAITLGRPVIVRSTEHFCEVAKVWDCAAAPVRDLANGTLLGILDVTSVGDLSDSHTLALAVTAAHLVEHSLHSRHLANSVQLLNWYRAAGSIADADHALLLDRKGAVIRAGAVARELLDQAAPTFDIRNGEPRIGADSPVRITRVIRYRLPADLADHERPSVPDWYGGMVLIAAQARLAADPVAPPPAKADIHPAFHRIVTQDPGLHLIMRQAQRMALAGAPVLLTGETGTGKELFARAIHACAAAEQRPFVAVNCGVLTSELAASELFGYVAGAFTGAAVGGRTGKFEEADGGTLFLDEVGELPPDVQVNLLRVLQDGVVVRVGGNTERHVDVRVIAATHRNLDAEVAAGRFREDLMYRLRVLSLTLPPLRERRGDIPLLAARYLEYLQATYGLGARTLGDDLLQLLLAHQWPGNVRELHGVLEALYILSERPLLRPADLPAEFTAAQARSGPASLPTPNASLDRRERDAIAEAIRRCGHNMSAAARELGISRSTLYRKIKRYGIALPNTDGA